MGLLRGKSSSRKSDCCESTPCDQCSCSECCNVDESSAEEVKKACCKPGCSSRKPCVSCIKSGVKPFTCSRPPRRTCVLAKACCTETSCERESSCERVIKIKSKCTIEKACCNDESGDGGDLDVVISINDSEPTCCKSCKAKCSPPNCKLPCCKLKCSKTKPCPSTQCCKPKCPPNCKLSCCEPTSCEEPCKPICSPPPPQPCRKLCACSCGSCTSSTSAVRFNNKDEIIPSGDFCEETKSSQKPSCFKKNGLDNAQHASNSIYVTENAPNFFQISPNMTKCWSNPVPCPCNSPSCRNSMMIFP